MPWDLLTCHLASSQVDAYTADYHLYRDAVRSGFSDFDTAATSGGSMVYPPSAGEGSMVGSGPLMI